MKKVVILLMAFAIVQTAHSQLPKIKNPFKKEKTEDAGEKEMDRRSLTTIAKTWNSGKFNSFKPYSSSFTVLEKSSATEIKFIKNDDGEVTAIEIGRDSYKPYSYGGSEFIDAYFKNHMNVLYLTEESIVKYYLDGTGSYKVKGIERIYGKKVKYKAMMEEIQRYRDYRDEKIDADREAIKQAEIAHRKKYTLEGKNVTKIEAVFPNGQPKTIVAGKKYKVGFKITLDDGTVLKTSNIGGHAYVEDLKVKSVDQCYIFGINSEYSTGLYGANKQTPSYLKVSSSNKPGSKDEASITIIPEYGGNAELKMSFTIAYPSKETFICSGEHGHPGYANGDRGGAAGHGCPVTLKAKASQHSKTGEKLYIIKVKDGFTSKESWYKIAADNAAFHLEVNGGKGGKGATGDDKQDDEYGAPGNGGTGGRGGNGGDIHVTLDPSAKDLKITYKNYGGAGGDGGLHGTCWSCPHGSDGNVGNRGPAGKDGSFEKEVKAVVF